MHSLEVLSHCAACLKRPPPLPSAPRDARREHIAHAAPAALSGLLPSSLPPAARSAATAVIAHAALVSCAQRLVAKVSTVAGRSAMVSILCRAAGCKGVGMSGQGMTGGRPCTCCYSLSIGFCYGMRRRLASGKSCLRACLDMGYAMKPWKSVRA
eukprot:1153815-Pelagomonas_calceolata.AAC.1